MRLETAFLKAALPQIVFFRVDVNFKYICREQLSETLLFNPTFYLIFLLYYILNKTKIML